MVNNNRDTTSYTHGATGTKPSQSLDFTKGENPKADDFDYFINYLINKTKDYSAEFDALDSNNDGKVDAADSADDATNVTSTYKNNDIDSDGDGRVNAADTATLVDGYDPHANLFDANDTGTVEAGEFSAYWQYGLPDGSTVNVTQATMTNFGAATPSGCDLVLATTTDGTTFTKQVAILSGDGITIYNNETGSPLSSYTNSSGAEQTVLIGVDNGHFNTGSGANQDMLSNIKTYIN